MQQNEKNEERSCKKVLRKLTSLYSLPIRMLFLFLTVMSGIFGCRVLSVVTICLLVVNINNKNRKSLARIVQMPFAKAWRNAMYPDFQAEKAYVDYKGLKSILHRMKEDIANPSTPDELYDSLLTEKKRVFDWSVKKATELLLLAEKLVSDTREYGSREGRVPQSPGSVNDTKALTDAIVQEVLRFQECRNLNSDTVDHIVSRQYRYTALGPSGRWLKINEEYDYTSISLDEIFYLLSVVYERIKLEQEALHGNHGSIPSGAMGSQVFDRRSVKYLVHKQDLPFIYARVIQHLPLSTIKDTYAEAKEHNLNYRMGQRISSVYYDNTNFLFYHRRLERLEGSSLFRIRWYTDSREEDANKVLPDSNVFIELKVHHEAWSGERSTKRRFAVKERDVDDYLKGQLSMDPAVEKLRKKKTPEKEIEKFKDLAAEILAKVKSYDMKPVLRTQCVRAAYQRGADASVRVSIDEELRMTVEDFGLGHHWRYAGKDPQASTNFPYAVVEVKLQCAENEKIAPWIEELMACRFMESVPKFSKYGHGIAALYGHTPRINMVPYWLHQIDSADIRAAHKPEAASWDPTLGLVMGCWDRTTDRMIFGTKEAQTKKVGAAEAVFLSDSDDLRAHYAKFAKANDLSGFEKKLDVGTFSPQRRHDAYTKFHLYPETFNATESICFQEKATANHAARVLEGTIPWQTGKRIKVPQKYDPKTLLTSERYMLKWVERATQLGLVSLATIHFGNSHDLPTNSSVLPLWWTAHFHVVFGVLLMIVAIGSALYALITFRARTRRVYARRKVRYDDVNGPTFLTAFLFLALIVTATHHIMLRYGPMLTGSDDL